MNAICYENTGTNLPGWVNTVHIEQKYGYAYETDSHFVHFYGKEPYYIISAGLTVTERKSGTLVDWCVRRFGANNIKTMTVEVGHSIESLWRPSLYYWDDTCAALKINESDQLSEESALRVLIQQLDNLLLYIEPSPSGLDCYSHKTRELLILSCTEVENQWRAILDKASVPPANGKTFTTNDYSRMIGKIYLEEFSVKLRSLSFQASIRPFLTWDAANPTKSIKWYDSYNETKHNRESHFDSARLRFVIESIAANLVLYSVRFSPLSLINNTNNFSSLVNQVFNISMERANRESFYLPLLDTSNIQRAECIVFDSYREKLNVPWVVDRLVL